MKKVFIPLALLALYPLRIFSMDESQIDFSQSIAQVELDAARKQDIENFVNIAIDKELTQEQQIDILTYMQTLKTLKLDPHFSIASIVFLSNMIEKLDTYIKSSNIPRIKKPRSANISESTIATQTIAQLSLPEQAFKIITKKQAENVSKATDLARETQEIIDRETENRIRIGLLKIEEEKCRAIAKEAVEKATEAEKVRLQLEANTLPENRLLEIQSETAHITEQTAKNRAALQQTYDSTKNRQVETPSSCIIS